MPSSLRRFGWWAVVITEVLLVAAATAYVGFGSWQFWLVGASAALGVIGYAVTVWITPESRLGDTGSIGERWYWF